MGKKRATWLDRMQAWLASTTDPSAIFEVRDGPETKQLDRKAVQNIVSTYAQGRPRQAALDELAAKVDRVRISGILPKPGEPGVLLDVRGEEARALVRHLGIVEGGDPFQCMCLGSELIELSSSGVGLAVIGLHHGRSIRWRGTWISDAMLAAPDRLCDWLAARGVPGPRRELGRRRPRLRARAP